MQPRDFLQQCEQIVRYVLRAYVLRRAKGQLIERVNGDLERCITDGLAVQMLLTEASRSFERLVLLRF